MENPIVKVEHLYHRYTSSRWAIEDINFQIDEAGVVGLLGSNGAGKSTTMNIICGVMRQTTGEVYIDGINTLKEPVKARVNWFLATETAFVPGSDDRRVFTFLCRNTVDG